jgi:hypothetical protein
MPLIARDTPVAGAMIAPAVRAQDAPRRVAMGRGAALCRTDT